MRLDFMKKVYYFVFLALVVALLLGGYFMFFQNESVLIVGLEYPPHSYTENGNIVGLHVEVAKRIFDEMGIDYEFQLNDWSDSLGMIREGRADVLMTASYKKDREGFIAYTEDQLNYDSSFDSDDTIISVDPIVFFGKVGDEKKMNVRNYDEIVRGKYRVGFVKDIAYFPDFFDKDMDFYSFKSLNEIIMALDDGVIDIFSIEKGVGEGAISELGFEERVGAIDWVLYNDPVYIVFSTRAGNEEIREKFYETLIRMKKFGELDDLYEKYGISKWNA